MAGDVPRWLLGRGRVRRRASLTVTLAGWFAMCVGLPLLSFVLTGVLPDGNRSGAKE